MTERRFVARIRCGLPYADLPRVVTEFVISPALGETLDVVRAALLELTRTRVLHELVDEGVLEAPRLSELSLLDVDVREEDLPIRHLH